MEAKILVVDDEEGITSSLVRYFRMLDYKADGVNSPVKALEMIHNENYMIVISDIMMPEMSGIEMLSKIKSFNGMIQVIMMTGVVTIENVLACLRNGANDCYLKPLDDLAVMKGAVDEATARLSKWESLIKQMIHRKH
ncbi:MAG: response regulator [Nitrospinae bacterium]|nr:response regulator [Nitrospinota bacterium]MBF0634853.1 response regulator [Nitrospinota bacterium]